MVKFFHLLLFCFILVFAKAQTHHFIYIENLYKQPFSVQFNGKKFESNSKNFVIVSKLENGLHTFKIITEFNKINTFSIDVDGNDLGFTLKKNTNDSWSLFDINRFTIIEQDTKEELVTKPIEKKIETPKQKNIDSNLAFVNVSQKGASKSVVKKISQSEKKGGLEEIYIDSSSKKIDTISIFIPYNTIVASDTVREAKAQPAIEQKMNSNNIDVAHPVANNCTAVATERDVSFFSSQIQAALMLKQKLKVAGSVLKEKCYTTNQIKRLGVLFLNESGKFNFYRLARTSVSDIANFYSLEKEFKDETLKKEFMALINHQ